MTITTKMILMGMGARQATASGPHQAVLDYAAIYKAMRAKDPEFERLRRENNNYRKTMAVIATLPADGTRQLASDLTEFIVDNGFSDMDNEDFRVEAYVRALPVHMRLATASGMEARQGQDAEERLDAKHDSPPGRPNTRRSNVTRD